MKNRILFFLQHLGIGQNAFEKSVGIATGFIHRMKDSISTRSLDKITARYPQLNKDWLLTGKGDMLVGPSEASPPDTVAVPREVFDQIARLTDAVLTQQQTIQAQQQTIQAQQETVGELVKKGAANGLSAVAK